MTRITSDLLNSNKLMPSVVAFLVKDGKVLLGLRKTSSVGLGLSRVAGIGGKVGDHPDYCNETHEEALGREVLEEIGVTPITYLKVGRVRFINLCKPKWSHDVTVYRVTEWAGNPVETESTRPSWFDIEALPVGQMFRDNHLWVPKVLAGEAVDFIILFDEENELIEHVEGEFARLL